MSGPVRPAPTFNEMLETMRRQMRERGLTVLPPSTPAEWEDGELTDEEARLLFHEDTGRWTVQDEPGTDAR